jgi:thiamine-monophosphate kinase
MTIPDEDAFTAKLARRVKAPARVRVAIGDDAAVVSFPAGPCAITTDTLVERIDFLAGESPYWIGRRAAAANLSDLAAMGAAPDGYLLTLGLPPGRGLEYGWKIADGVISKMRESGATLWGGDLTRSREVFVTVCLIGRADRPVTRRGARPGDLLFVTGTPGEAARGLRRRRRRKGKRLTRSERAYLDPPPRIRFAALLAQRRLATAMIDVSDGLGKDASRLAAASGVRLEFDAIGLEALRESGDDFELLFTAPARHTGELMSASARTGTPVSPVGRVAAGRGVFWRGEGRRIAVGAWGYDHFRRRTGRSVS